MTADRRLPEGGRGGQEEPVSAGSGPKPEEIAKCRGCGADIYWMKSPYGKNIPVNVVPTLSGYRGPNSGEIEFIWGEHETHFRTCPEADRFRKR